MKLRLLTTTALALALVAPGTLAAQTTGAPSTGTQQGGQSQSRQPVQSSAQPQQGQQQLQQAMQQLRDAQRALEQAGQPTGGQPAGNQQAVNQARQDATQAVRQIEQSLQQRKSQGGQGDQPKIQSAQTRIEEARRVLDRQDATPDAMAAALGEVERAISGMRMAGSEAGGANIQVRQPPAEVTVEKQAPEVVVTQRKPEVTVRQAEPQVTVRQPEPEVTVRTAEPTVNVTRSGEPTVTVEKDDQAAVAVREPNQSAAAGAREQQGQPPRADARDSASPDMVAWSRGEVVGKDLYGANDEHVGEIEDVVMGQDGQVESLLVEVGSFLGIGGKQVAIPTGEIQLRGDRMVADTLTKERIEDMPAKIDSTSDSVSSQLLTLPVRESYTASGSGTLSSVSQMARRVPITPTVRMALDRLASARSRVLAPENVRSEALSLRQFYLVQRSPPPSGTDENPSNCAVHAPKLLTELTAPEPE
ncbi:PRC protein [alpha proteobacterium BAL199]|nr:PRC protein [alpha proteobacterium BAL199]